MRPGFKLVLACGGALALVWAGALVWGNRYAFFPKKHTNEDSAISALRTIAESERIFRDGDRDGNGKADYGTLDALLGAKLVDSVLGSGTKQGYVFMARPGADPERSWWATARPLTPVGRVFFTNETGAIHAMSASDPGSRADPDPRTGKAPEGAIPVGR